MATSVDANGSLWATLRGITSAKRHELAKQRDAYKNMRKHVLDSIASEADPRKRVRALLKESGKREVATTSSSSSPSEGLDALQSFTRADPIRWKRQIENPQHEELLALSKLSAQNIQRILLQSESDKSIPAAYFEDVEKRFCEALRMQDVKLEYATLFSELVTEGDVAPGPSSDASSEPEIVGREEMHTQRKEWEELVFGEPPVLDKAEIQAKLQKVFGSPEAKERMDDLRRSSNEFCHTLQTEVIDLDTMKSIVRGLIAADLLSDVQTETLKQIRDSDSSLKEVIDVLHLRLKDIQRWSWETDAVFLDMRRHLNGKYRVFMDEELTAALLIHYIGAKFSCHFAQSFECFYISSGWKKAESLTRDDLAQWDYFIGKRHIGRPSGIRELMDNAFHEKYFMSALPRNLWEGDGGYDETQVENAAKESRVQKSIEAKQAILHTIVCESILADVLDKSGDGLVVLQTDFRWFGPSLSHTTIAAVLEFFGVSDVWLSFFNKFLSAPLRFRQDGPNGQVRTRKRGVPISHSVSNFLGEAVLFTLDFAVNEATNGSPLYRLHDDVFFWGSEQDVSVAWQTISEMKTVLGLAINEEKTGSARLLRTPASVTSPAKPLPAGLPVGPLRWGLLHTEGTGQFVIDQAKVDEHIVELRRQLASRTSTLAWIRAYNSYAAFLKLHFCRTENVLGRAHVDDCVQTFARVNAALCPETQGDVAAHVKNMIQKQNGVTDIPTGFVFFPMTLGGLELHNPFVDYQGIRDLLYEHPTDAVRVALDEEEVKYRRLAKLFEREGPVDRAGGLAEMYNDGKKADWAPGTAFMSRETYVRFRRDRSSPLKAAWLRLLSVRSQYQHLFDEKVVQATDEVTRIMPEDIRETTDTYWRAIFELHGPGMEKIFGSAAVVDRSLLPLGLVDMLKKKTRWDA
ncbi:hypothetical protein HKX48_003398 [Thoreauomyces humboldtii]|nr:hypothetical protein HKX48_003398 [Thoreauomyces humboldtii]